MNARDVSETIQEKVDRYPESVLKVSEYLRRARENTPPEEDEEEDMVQCKDKADGKGGYPFQTPANIDTTPPSSDSSGSTTPTDSPGSSVSCSHHSCGSLFAKCAEHGRWPLLQTFTNRDSPLSQQTFSNRYPSHKTNNFVGDSERRIKGNGTESPTYENFVHACCKRQQQQKQLRQQSNKTILTLEDPKSCGILKRREKKPSKNKVQFAEIQETERKPNEQLIIRRHNSLPPRGTITNLNKSFDNYRGYCKNEDRGSKKKIESNRGRSKSEDKMVTKKYVWVSEPEQNRVRKEVIDSEEATFPDNFCDKCQKNTANECLLLKSCSKNKENNSDKEYCSCRGKNNAFRDRAKEYATCLCNYDEFGLIVSKLNNEAKQWEHKIDFLETEVLLLRRELKKKDQENLKLQREIHKLRSVLQETSIFKQEGDLLSSLQDSHGMPGQIQQVVNIPNPNKKQGISGESSDHGRNHDQIEIQRFEKDFRSKQLIKDAIMGNDFLKNLDTSQVREIVESVYPMEFSKGDYVVREGEAGSHLYVSAVGELEVIKDNKVLGRMGPGKAFGELAILYNCRRTASIKVVSDAKVWVLDRQVFQKIMMKTGLQRLQENLNFLRSVPLLQSLSNEVLAKIADVLEVDFYPSGEHIIRQGATGDTFFIISSGSVKVTQQKPGRQEEEEIRILNKGDYFGEQALLKEDCRTANVIALSPGVECLTLDRDSFIQLIGDLSELQEKDYGDQVRGFSRPSSSSSLSDKQEYDYIRLEDLETVSTLGVGGFGRVELVQYSKNKSITFALKCLKKQHIVETKQQEHVYSERNIMMACNSPFICRLYRTFRDSKYVYMLQEALLGGEVWTILRERGYFDDYTTKFVTGCVLEAFEYLHARGIIYRDLKPENLLLDNMGYAKLVDFGFSKRLGFSSKTWTFCGTPEYLAPEIILNKGHDRAVDYWSLGVLMHELLTGTPPFTAPDPMRTYNIILKGIDMIDFPKYITRSAQSLIKRLCRDAPSERLGYQRGGIQDIKKHKWFQGFDWAGLKQRALTPPITPLVRSPTDTSNFDYYSKETAVPPDEFSNWDADF